MRLRETLLNEGWEWGARSIQGAYFHWVVGNALLPPEDTDPSHTGVQIVDRETVPELAGQVTTSVAFSRFPMPLKT